MQKYEISHEKVYMFSLDVISSGVVRRLYQDVICPVRLSLDVINPGVVCRF